MKPLVFLAPLLCLLIGATPSPAVPLGKFQTWLGRERQPLNFTSDGIEIKVEALPCSTDANTQSPSCVDGYNDQAAITLTAPGLPPFHMNSDSEAIVVRVAAVRFDQRQTRSGAIVDNQWGGTLGMTTMTAVVPIAGGFRAVAIKRRPSEREVAGEIADFPGDVSGDGIIDFVLEDHDFA